MYYIFNSDGILVGTSNQEPDMEDLKSRGEYYSKNVSGDLLNFDRVVGGKYGGIYETVETPEELTIKETNKILQQRNKILTGTDWITTRHFEEKMLGKEISLTDLQISEFLIYRQSLRDITQIEGFPFITLPQQPEFLE